MQDHCDSSASRTDIGENSHQDTKPTPIKITSKTADTSKTKRYSYLEHWWILLFLFVLVVWYLSKEISGFFGVVPKEGDGIFAAVSSLFSGLAFAGVVIAILLQRKAILLQHEDLMLQREDLAMQREETERTRREFESQTKEFKEQNENLSIQRFENTFFNMLNLLNEIINSMAIHQDKGRKCFTWLYQQLKSKSDSNQDEAVRTISNLPSGNLKGYFSEIYKDEYLISTFSPYIRTFYNIINFIDQSTLDPSRKKIYSNILQGSTSESEFIFLICHCLHSRNEEHRLLIERHELLKHIKNKFHRNVCDALTTGTF